MSGHLILGMMWQSRKALDLCRDPRCVVHTCTTDRTGTEGDAKIYARAVDVHDPQLRQAYREAVRARIDRAPDVPNFHAFSVDVVSAGFITFAEPKTVIAWDRGVVPECSRSPTPTVAQPTRFSGAYERSSRFSPASEKAIVASASSP